MKIEIVSGVEGNCLVVNDTRCIREIEQLEDKTELL